MKRKLEITATFKEAATIGKKNALPLLLTGIIYVLTLWIPYINIGTSIAMATLPGKLAQGESISPLFIFDSVYRRQIGNFLLYTGLYIMMLIPAVLFLNVVIPVLLIMYSLSLFIMIDEDTTPIEALEMSRKATCGFKWTIFFIVILYILALNILPGIILLPFWGIGALIDKLSDGTFFTSLFAVIGYLVAVVFSILGTCYGYALYAVIYRNLYLNNRMPEKPATQTENEQVFRQEIETTSNAENTNPVEIPVSSSTPGGN